MALASYDLFLSLILLSLCGVSTAQIQQLCLDFYDPDNCQQVSRDLSTTCQFVASKVDCILDADQGVSTLSVLKPEEALLGAALVKGQASVIGEILTGNTPYQTAVIVRSSYVGGFDALHGLKYCHPGYDHDELITTYVLEELDRNVTNFSCNTNKTLTEQKFEALSSTFGSSCRPGQWTADDDLDAELKNRYSSLCELCGTEKCKTQYSVPFNDTLTCLSEKGGDLALTTLMYAKAFFNVGSNAQDFKFLCPNGTVAPASNPCTWTNQLNHLIISSSSSAAIAKAYIEGNLPSYVINGSLGQSSQSIEPKLAQLLKLSKTDKINLITPKPLSNYVAERRHIPTINESIRCEITAKWSVTNMVEQNKCEWLQQASLNVGLQPVIECIMSIDNDTVSNLDNMRDGNADFAFADANYGYVARRKGLSNVAYPETNVKQLSHIIIALRSDDTSWYKGLSDLKGRGVCLPEYAGKEWLAFINLLRTGRIFENSDSTDYEKLFGEFVGNSCAPGANSKDLNMSNGYQEKLCANCVPVSAVETAKYCNADNGNKYYDSFGALTCLSDGLGDYAVITINDLPQSYRNNLTAHDRFIVVSKNGSLASYTGFQVDEESPITIITAGEVLIQNNSSKYRDILLYLKEIEQQFGQNQEKAFKVFDRFDHIPDLLFPDSTPGLTFGGTPNKYIDNFKTLLSNSEKGGTDSPSNSYKNVPAFYTVIVFLSIFFMM